MWEKLVANLQHYFRIGRREAIGFFIVFLFLIVLLLLPSAYKQYAQYYLATPPASQSDFDALEEQLAYLRSAREQNQQTDETAQRGLNRFQKTTRHELFPFNPNTASKEELMRLGLSARVAANIIKYRSAGENVFNTKEKLKKIWGISPEKYEELAPYITLPTQRLAEAKSPTTDKAPADKEPSGPFPFNPNQVGFKELVALGFPDSIAGRIIGYRNKVDTFQVKEDLLVIYDMPQDVFYELYAYIDLPEQAEDQAPSKELKPPNAENKKQSEEAPAFSGKIDINQADSTRLTEINGIGKVLSSRITKTRDALGGFYSPRQLREVYGLKDETIERLLEKTDQNSFSDKNLRKLNVYQADFETLEAHPYINRQLAEYIVVKSKRKKGITFDELKSVYGVNLYKLELLEPYLSFERESK